MVDDEDFDEEQFSYMTPTKVRFLTSKKVILLLRDCGCIFLMYDQLDIADNGSNLSLIKNKLIMTYRSYNKKVCLGISLLFLVNCSL